MACLSISELSVRDARDAFAGHLSECPRCRAIAHRLAGEGEQPVDSVTRSARLTAHGQDPKAGGVWTFWAPRSEEYLVGGVLEAGETDLLLIPLLAETDWAVDADVALRRDVLGYEALALVWAADRVLLEQAVEPVGVLSEEHLGGLTAAYQAYRVHGRVPKSAGPPILKSTDPRTAAQAARADDLHVFYDPWAQLQVDDELGPVMRARREQLGIDLDPWCETIDVGLREWVAFEQAKADPRTTVAVKAMKRALAGLQLLASRRVLELAGASVRRHHEDMEQADGNAKARRRRGVRQPVRRDPAAAEEAAQSYMQVLAKELEL